MTPHPRHLRAVSEPEREVSGEPSEAWAGDGLDEVTAPADPFLQMVEAAEGVTPLHGQISELAPADLLRMLGGTPAAAGAPALHAPGQKERRALLERLAAAAWDVVRAGAADHDPDLLDNLVLVCTRLAQPAF